ncbi:hypothetical protein BGZ52_003731, partial [Haplosporangium bisporale]
MPFYKRNVAANSHAANSHAANSNAVVTQYPQYRHVSDLLSKVELFRGSRAKNARTAISNIQKLGLIVTACGDYGIPSNTLFNDIDLSKFLCTY